MTNHRLARRDFLTQSSAALVAGGLASSLAPSAQAQQPSSGGGHTLPKLPYAYDALEPVIDTKTMTIHHTKHHQGYVDKLNAALEGHADLAKLPIDDLMRKVDSLPDAIKTAVRNNGGGHANHSLFWKCMQPVSAPNVLRADSPLMRGIDSAFGGAEKLKQQFSTAGATQFGSGWAWLVVDGGKLDVVATANQDTPLSMGKTPILGLDVWEHAYYLQYQNRRADYIEAWWKVVNWSQVAQNLADA
jgi:Fe-Mn family superoxide dismutase